ncbi:MAG TPA: hypothetical protein VF062_24500 [Candidatus Limnocylindrales bacterium]
MTAVIAIIVMVGGMLWGVSTFVPWRDWLGITQAYITGCDIKDHARPWPTEAGLADAGVEVRNPTAKDRKFAVTVVVIDARDEVVGSVTHEIGVPANQLRWQTWRVILTRLGGVRCDVAKTVELTDG